MSQRVEATLEVAVQAGPRKKGMSVYWRRFRRDKRAVFGLVILLAFAISAALGGLITPYDAQAQHYELLEPPTIGHPLGTDNIGRDLLSRLMIGARTSMIVAIFGLALAALVGIPLGVLSGFYGGWVDMAVMRYIDIQFAFPNFRAWWLGTFPGLVIMFVVLAVNFVGDAIDLNDVREYGGIATGA